jgi:hypothetical protein
MSRPSHRRRFRALAAVGLLLTLGLAGCADQPAQNTTAGSSPAPVKVPNLYQEPLPNVLDPIETQAMPVYGKNDQNQP